jgi:TRAP-type C4-dicarboxylate transport system permease large subunit
MSSKARLFLLFAVIAFVIAGLRFMPSLGISSRVTDFAGGLGVGFLIGALVNWTLERDVS